MIARDLIPNCEKLCHIICHHPGLDLFPQCLELGGYEMTPDCAEHVPRAEKNPALWVDNFERRYLRLIAIGHDYTGPDQWTGVLHPFEKECYNIRRRI